MLKPRRALLAARKAADRDSGRPAADRLSNAVVDTPKRDVDRRRKTGKQKRIIVAGSRTFDRYGLLKKVMNRVADEKYPDHEIIVLSGAAKGADKLGEKWAFSRWFTVELHFTDWDKHGKKAGPIRNGEMAKAGDVLIAFWDGKSPGTKDMIRQAKHRGLKVKVVRFKER